MIDKHITFEHLKGCFLQFAKGFFGSDTQIRLRPATFRSPSLQPRSTCRARSAEVAGARCAAGPAGLNSGAGMVHPNVIRNGGYDPDEVTGFAFGFGLDRAAMLKWGIDDLRVLFDNDMRFLTQFRGL